MQNHASNPAGSTLEHGLHISHLQVRQFLDYLLGSHSSRQQIEHIVDADAHSPNTGLATALRRKGVFPYFYRKQRPCPKLKTSCSL